MDETHITAFGRLLDVMARNLSHRTLDRDDKAAYLIAVDDLPFEAVQYACKQVFRSETFMPAPAIVRAYATDWVKRQRGAHLDAPTSDAEFLALREALITPAEIHALIQSALPGYGWELPQEDHHAAD